MHTPASEGGPTQEEEEEEEEVGQEDEKAEEEKENEEEELTDDAEDAEAAEVLKIFESDENDAENPTWEGEGEAHGPFIPPPPSRPQVSTQEQKSSQSKSLGRPA